LRFVSRLERVDDLSKESVAKSAKKRDTSCAEDATETRRFLGRALGDGSFKKEAAPSVGRAERRGETWTSLKAGHYKTQRELIKA
jgi:hypothetical protein